MTWLALLGLVVALLALAFVLYPLLRPLPTAEEGQPALDRAELRQSLYRQVLDIELDQRIGKLDAAEARELSAGLLRQAAALLAGEADDETENPHPPALQAAGLTHGERHEPGEPENRRKVTRVEGRPILLGMLVLSSLATWAPTVDAASDGVIEGQISNATREGPQPAGVPVNVHVLRDGERVELRPTVADAGGRYRLDGLETAGNLQYLAVVEYQGGLYFAAPLKLAEEHRKTADITVYEATSSDQWIAFERANLLVQNVAPARLEVMEMGAVANVGDRTYVGQGPSGEARSTLRFSVPAGARELEPQFGFLLNDLTPTPKGFLVGGPVPPGRHQLAYRYNLPSRSDRLEVSKLLDYPTMSFNLYVPDIGVQVTSPQLQPQGQADFGGRRFLLFTAQNLPRGTELKIVFNGLPTPGGSLAEMLTWPLLGVGSAVMLAGIGLVYRRRQRLATETALAAEAA